MTDLVPNLSTACVLLVEDDRALRELVATYLRQNALNVIEAGDGMEMRAALAPVPAAPSAETKQTEDKENCLPPHG